MAYEAKCPNCGEKGSIKEAITINIKTGKPHWRPASYVLRALIGSIFILIGIMFLVPFIGAFFFETTSSRPNVLFGVIAILFLAGCPLGFGAYLILTMSAVSADMRRLYRFECSQCKKKWDQWQTEGWEQVQCPNCGGFKVILRSLMVDPSGKSVKVDNLILGLLGSLFGSFIIGFGIWIRRVPLPPGGSGKSPLFFVVLGVLMLSWSLPMLVKYLRRKKQKKQLTYVCFECDRQWLHEGKTK